METPDLTSVPSILFYFLVALIGVLSRVINYLRKQNDQRFIDKDKAITALRTEITVLKQEATEEKIYLRGVIVSINKVVDDSIVSITNLTSNTDKLNDKVIDVVLPTVKDTNRVLTDISDNLKTRANG